MAGLFRRDPENAHPPVASGDMNNKHLFPLLRITKMVGRMHAFLLILSACLVSLPHDSFAQVSSGPASGSVHGGARVSTKDAGLLRSLSQGSPAIPDLVEGVRPAACPLPPNHPSPTAPEGSNLHNDNPAATGGLGPPPVIIGSYPGAAQTNSFPPDPQIAAGPAHIMQAVNREIEICDKSGTLIKSIDAGSWFDGVLPGAVPFDPSLRYDHFAGRWIMTWLNRTDTSSHCLLSVSESQDPDGGWFNWALPADRNGMVASGTFADNDFLGYDSSAIYIVTDQYGLTQGTIQYAKVRIIPKLQLLSSTRDSLSWVDFWNLPDPTLGVSYHVRPAVVYGSAPAYYLAAAPWSVSATYMLLYTIRNPTATPSMSVDQIPVTQWRKAPDPQQPGGLQPIDGDGSLMHSPVIYRDGSLWGVHTVANPSNEYSRIHYFRINTTTKTATEDVSYGSDGYWYSYPAIEVDRDKNVALTFCRSGSAEYMGAWFTWRLDGEALHPSIPIAPGKAPYLKLNPDDHLNRWGDYMSAAIDPADGSNFWFLTEYADTPSNTWGTRMLNVRLIPFPGPHAASDVPSIDFGVENVGGHSDSAALAIVNVGSPGLTLSSFTHVSSAFQVLGLPGFPLTLDTYGSLNTRVVFAPRTGGVITDTIVTESNDPMNPSFRIPLTGSGIALGNADTGVIYAAKYSPTGSSLYRVRPSDFTAVELGSTGMENFISLAVRGDEAQVYGIVRTAINTVLCRIDTKSGQFYNPVTIPLQDLSAIAFGPHDSLYGGTLSGKLYHISLPAGDTTLLGINRDLSYAGMAFNPGRSSLWASAESPSNDTLYRVNMRTGDASSVGATGFALKMTALCFDSQGTLYGLVGSAIVSIDTSSGRGTRLSLLPIEGIRALAMRTDPITTGLSSQDRPVPSYSLSQNYPNPFNPTTLIRYGLPQRSKVKLMVYSILGQEVALLVDVVQEPGNHEVVFDGSKLSSGMYFCRMQAGNFVQTRKLMLLH